jgi:hypothetical protein
MSDAPPVADAGVCRRCGGYADYLVVVAASYTGPLGEIEEMPVSEWCGACVLRGVAA